jgi:hypothetical protein
MLNLTHHKLVMCPGADLKGGILGAGAPGKKKKKKKFKQKSSKKKKKKKKRN